MSQTNIVIIIYIIGIIIGALFFDLWSAETNIIKSLSALAWTVIMLIALLYSDREKKK